jgi:hypothetical protein
MRTTDEHGKFYDASGRNVHTTRHTPCRRGFLGRRIWFPVLRHDGILFVDDKRFEDGFRVYREVPDAQSWD